MNDVDQLDKMLADEQRADAYRADKILRIIERYAEEEGYSVEDAVEKILQSSWIRYERRIDRIRGLI